MTFTARRLVVLALQLVAITLVSFALTHIVPADPVAANLSVEAQSDPRIVAAFRHKFGLDQPVPMQYIKYMQQLVHGDFGLSLQTGAPIRRRLAEAVPASFELAGVAVVIAVLCGVGLGIVLGIGLARGVVKGVLDALIIGSLSTPTFWLALLGYYLLFYRFGLFPGGGRLDPGAAPPPHVTGFYTVDAALSGQWATFGSTLQHLLLPAFVLAGSTIGLLIRYTSAAVQEAMGNDYVRSGRAKGLTEWTVALRYVVRPALLSIITVAGVAFGHLLAGTVLVESVFDWPGLGQYGYRSALALDVPAVIGVTIVIAFIYVAVNFCVDLCYPLIDPRLGART